MHESDEDRYERVIDALARASEIVPWEHDAKGKTGG